MSYVIGYARSSTVDQTAGFEAQKRELTAAGCRRVFEEQVSSLAQRAQLEAAIAYLGEGDVLVVTSLDRLARSMRDLIALVDRIRTIGASLRILNMNLDTHNATSDLILNVIGSVAQWERCGCSSGRRKELPPPRRRANTRAVRRRPGARPIRCTL